MKKIKPKSNGPKDAATSKGPNAKAVEAIALPQDYPKATTDGKRKSSGSAMPNFAHFARARVVLPKLPVETQSRPNEPEQPNGVFCDSAGRKWAYRGKRARVLALLVRNGCEGVTQWDCLPCHTRLGASIHAMRCDGLEISTEREGEYRHARYRLHTPGSLIILANNSVEAVHLHRNSP